MTMAKKLPDYQRRELAVRLFESIDSQFDSPELDAAWAFEIKRRLDEMKSGKVKSYTWEQVERMIDRDLEKMRGAQNSRSSSARNAQGNSMVRTKKSASSQKPKKKNP